MKILFVAPSQLSSGEAITAFSIAEDISAGGGKVRLLASNYTARFLPLQFSDVVEHLTDDLAENQQRWWRVLREFSPDAVVFADYPLLFFSSGVTPLVDERWLRSLRSLDAVLVTLDHLGYAQGSRTFFFGPPHLSHHAETTPELPERMAILLPCPVQAPTIVPGRSGVPFRYWRLPLGLQQDEKQTVRQRYLEDNRDYLIFHSVPSWSIQFAEAYRLPHHKYLSRILSYYLEDLPRPVTIVSVNDGQLLEESHNPHVQFLNLSALPKQEYERLLFASDLMITDNAVSVSLGKAVCALVPCVVLRNSYRLSELLQKLQGPLRQLMQEMEHSQLGSIFPYEVFPIWGTQELIQLGLRQRNSLYEVVHMAEFFGDQSTREQLHRLLNDERTRQSVRAKQESYVQQVHRLDSAADLLGRILARPLAQSVSGQL